MKLIHEDKQKRFIKDREEVKFSSFSSFHLISIGARARSEKQISKEATDDEELTVKIDGKAFPKLGSKEAFLDSPASFNGGQLHSLLKIIYFLTFLKGKEHTILLETDKPPYNTATLEELEVYTLNLDSIISLGINRQAEDGNIRHWITFALDNLPLRAVIPTITYSHRKWDSDDVKIIIDGKTQGNLFKDANEGTKQAWQESYEIAKGILNGSLEDTTGGATNFHSFKRKEEFPNWATDEAWKITVGDIYFYELER